MEAELIAWLRDNLPAHPRLALGIGDDAAILRWSEGRDCVITTDTLTDQVDFILTECDPRRAGRKALAVNLSDLAAMAVRPVAATVAVVLPRKGGQALARQLYQGILPLAAQLNVAIAGGDTNSWEGPLVISVTAVGEVTEHGVWRRSAAQAGDAILVTGELGGSLLGKHFDFAPRVEEALLLSANYHIHAAIDISDGLSLDISRLAAASSCGALLDLSCIPVSEAAVAALAEAARLKRLHHALADGEDFELVLTLPPDEAVRLVADQPLGIPVTRIGQCIHEPGLWQQSEPGGEPRRLPARGYEHRMES